MENVLTFNAVSTAAPVPVRVHYWDGSVKEFSATPAEHDLGPAFLIKHVEVLTVSGDCSIDVGTV